jgi:RNA 2',3'-cyclic 3'-phosphodiesterase
MNQVLAQRELDDPGMAPSGVVRSFVAVPLPGEVRAAILEAIHAALPDGTPALSVRLPALRWAHRAENLHVTLKFLGQVDQGLLAQFAAALAQGLASIPDFEIQLRGLGAFPSPQDAQVIWVGVDDPSQRLGQVARIVQDLADRLAVGRDQSPQGRPRAFRAHVTLGRVPRRARQGVDAALLLASWADRDLGRVPVNQIHLYESITGGDASTYVLRGKATLEGATDGDGKDRDQGSN